MAKPETPLAPDPLPDPSGVTVAILARNEQPLAARLVRQVQPYAEEVMLVDCHSTDGTREAAQAAGARVELDGGRGKGDGVRTAIARAQTPYLVLMDCDGSHEAESIPNVVAPLREDRLDPVIGSRVTGGSDEILGDLKTVARVFGGHIVTLAINWRFGTRLTETVNGFRALRVAMARALDLREDGFTIEPELVIRALQRGYRVGDAPAHERARQHGQAHLDVVRAAPYYLAHLLYLLAQPKVRRE